MFCSTLSDLKMALHSNEMTHLHDVCLYIHMVYYDNIYYDLRAKSNAQTRIIYQALWLHFQRYLNINQNTVAVQKKKTANNVKQIFQIEIHQF